MTNQDNKTWWMATAVETGTNDRIYVEAATKDEINTKLFGRHYSAKRDSVVYYRIDPPKGSEQ